MFKLIAATLIAASLAIVTPAHADEAPRVDGFNRVHVVGDSIAWGYAEVVRAPGTVVDHSIPGSCLFTTDHCYRPGPGPLIHRLRGMAINPGDTVVIAIGTNDLDFGRMSQYSAAYREAVRYVRSQGASPLVATITPYAAGLAQARPVTDTLRVRVNAWLMRSGFPVVDLATVLGGDHMRARYDSGDGLHPNHVGSVVLGRAVTAAVS